MSDSNVDISVIIPAYNREDYISKCIESVLNQGAISMEIIIIDDGSTDRTLDICNGLAKEYSCIHVIHQVNQGLESARNTGLDAATGKYITFLDSDDYISPGAFTSMLKTIRDNGVDAVIGQFDIFSENGALIGKGLIPDGFKSSIIDSKTFWKLNSMKQCNILFTVVWGKLFKKDIWENLRFADGVRFAEDEYVLPELVRRCNSFYLLDHNVYQQIASIDSLSRSVFDGNKLNSPDSKLRTCKYLIEQGLNDCAVEKWGIAVGEIMLMTRLADGDVIREKIKMLQWESVALGQRLFASMDVKKKCKYLGYRIGYPLYYAIYGKR